MNRRQKIALVAGEIRKIKALLGKESSSLKVLRNAVKLGYEKIGFGGIGFMGLNGYAELHIEAEDDYAGDGMIYVMISWTSDSGISLKDIEKIKGFYRSEGMKGSFAGYVKTEQALAFILKDLADLYYSAGV